MTVLWSNLRVNEGPKQDVYNFTVYDFGQNETHI